MPRAEVGTPKYLANAMKAKGLQRLRWYCQVCQKQCRDDNGFKCHLATEAHLRQMLVVGESAGKHVSDFSSQFQSEFVTLLSRSFGTNRVKANNVYQQYIQDRHHLHMNSTRWISLTEFVKHLGRTGVVRVDETEKGLFIQWIDNSPKALAKAEASQKKERATTSDEQRERNRIAEQIARAKAEEESAGQGSSASDENEEAGVLKREEGSAPLKLAFGAPKKAETPASDEDQPELASVTVSSSEKTVTSAPVKPQAALKFNAFKSGSLVKATPAKPSTPLKMNVFKSGGLKSSSAPIGPAVTMGEKRSREGLSVAEQLMLEDQERKRRRVEIGRS